MATLTDTIAIVTGASRGAGRAIAVELGAAGATVYVTGRSLGGKNTLGLETATLEETAQAVEAAGGKALPVRCDHTNDEDVQALFAKVKDEHGRLDVLVNNVWGGYEGHDEGFENRFWDQPMWRWDKMFNAGVRAHFTASQQAAPLMIEAGRGLIVSTTAWDRNKYLGVLPYDVAKTAIHRMIYGMALELKDHGVSAVAVAPGWMRTEMVLAAFDTDEQHWQDADELATTESPRYLGRAIAHLAADDAVAAYSGRVVTVADLARQYGFTDYDGRQPPAFRIPEDYLLD